MMRVILLAVLVLLWCAAGLLFYIPYRLTTDEQPQRTFIIRNSDGLPVCFATYQVTPETGEPYLVETPMAHDQEAFPERIRRTLINSKVTVREVERKLSNGAPCS